MLFIIYKQAKIQQAEVKCTYMDKLRDTKENNEYCKNDFERSFK